MAASLRHSPYITACCLWVSRSATPRIVPRLHFSLRGARDWETLARATIRVKGPVCPYTVTCTQATALDYLSPSSGLACIRALSFSSFVSLYAAAIIDDGWWKDWASGGNNWFSCLADGFAWTHKSRYWMNKIYYAEVNYENWVNCLNISF